MEEVKKRINDILSEYNKNITDDCQIECHPYRQSDIVNYFEYPIELKGGEKKPEIEYFDLENITQSKRGNLNIALLYADNWNMNEKRNNRSFIFLVKIIPMIQKNRLVDIKKDIVKLIILIIGLFTIIKLLKYIYNVNIIDYAINKYNDNL